ncbi:hypothetical protein [Bacteroides sedimenti]|uniref:Uncharacterized protein n=1 Tax=Bacteroides sedimenti TaxID=2136147 RepID=A0ABM8IC18_9BACE
MKKHKKSTWLCLALFVYVTVTAIYLVPRNTSISDLEKILTVGISYVVVFLLWLILRRKEKLAEQRRREMGNNKNTKELK